VAGNEIWNGYPILESDDDLVIFLHPCLPVVLPLSVAPLYQGVVVLALQIRRASVLMSPLSG
jgi:hypothetical protein